MSELLLDRWFEIKEFKTVEEKTIFEMRELLIGLALKISFDLNIINWYLDWENENMAVNGILNHITFLSNWKIKIVIESDNDIYNGSFVFINECWKPIDISKIEFPVDFKVQSIISDTRFKIEDLQISVSNKPTQKALIAQLLQTLLKKYY